MHFLCRTTLISTRYQAGSGHNTSLNWQGLYQIRALFAPGLHPFGQQLVQMLAWSTHRG
jgi:hypothetical protein